MFDGHKHTSMPTKHLVPGLHLTLSHRQPFNCDSDVTFHVQVIITLGVTCVLAHLLRADYENIHDL